MSLLLGQWRWSIVAMCVMVSLLWPTASATSVMCPCAHRFDLLMELYNATSGASWWKRDGWGQLLCSSSSEPNWFGLTCEGGDITAVVLPSNHLVGTLPTSWSAMTSLTTVNVANNTIFGTLPTSWASLTAMEFMSVYSNVLAGTLPYSWSGMQNMRVFTAYANVFVGELPSSWSSWELVTVVDVSSNSLNGTLPPSWATMRAIQNISLMSNAIGGALPDVWGNNMTQLSFLLLNNNQLSGSLPSSWSAMTKMVQLIVNDNHISGTLPASWSSMASLSVFRVHNNQLTGTLPPSYSSMRGITELVVNGNQLTGTLPDTYATMTQLQVFFAYTNQLTGSLPDAWRSMLHLTQFDVTSNALSGTLPASWSTLTSLTNVFFINNQFSGTLPASWGAWGAVLLFSVANNQLTGSLPSAWSDMRSLEFMELNDNSLTGTLPSSWGALSNLISFAAFDNRLSGPLPASWSALSNLIMVSLGFNSLSGPLPSSWGSLSRLQYLYVHHNALEGTLPAAWQALHSLQWILVQQNRLRGSLPAAWSTSFPRLTGLNVSWNCLSGSLPSSWVAPFRQHVDLCRSGVISASIQAGWAVNSCNTSDVSPLRQCGTSTGTTTQTQSLPRATHSVPMAATQTQSLPRMAAELLTPPASLSDATGAVSVGVALLMSPGVALGIRRFGVIRSFGSCSDDERATVEAVMTVADAAPLDSPLQLHIQDGRGSTQRGTVIGNFIVLAIAAVISCIAVTAHNRWQDRSSTRQRRRQPFSFARSAAALSLPGALMGVISVLLQPTVVAATQLIGYGNGTGDAAAGAFGLCATLLLAATLARVLDPRELRFFAVAFAVPPEVHARGSHRHNCKRRWYLMTDPSCVWRLRQGHNQDQYAVEQYSALFESCRGGRHWWMLVETFTTVMVSVLGGVVPESESSCDAIAWLAAALCVALLVAYLIAKPANSALETVTAIALLGAQCVVALCVAIGNADSVADGIGLAATILSCLQALASFAVIKLFHRAQELSALVAAQLHHTSKSGLRDANHRVVRVSCGALPNLLNLPEWQTEPVPNSSFHPEARSHKVRSDAALRSLVQTICYRKRISSIP